MGKHFFETNPNKNMNFQCETDWLIQVEKPSGHHLDNLWICDPGGKGQPNKKEYELEHPDAPIKKLNTKSGEKKRSRD